MKKEISSSFIKIKIVSNNKLIEYKIDLDQIPNGVIQVNKILDNQMSI